MVTETTSQLSSRSADLSPVANKPQVYICAADLLVAKLGDRGFIDIWTAGEERIQLSRKAAIKLVAALTEVLAGEQDGVVVERVDLFRMR